MTHEAAQEPSRKPRAAGDEGAPYTKLIMDEVKRQRTALDWTAERLAEEMTAAGVPWTRDMVVNLENGRRKALAVHEVLTLAVVLDVSSPLDLLAPGGDGPAARIPVTPNMLVAPVMVREWFTGKIGPLRRWADILLTATSTMVEGVRDGVRKGTFTEDQAEQVIAGIAASAAVAISQPADG